MLELQAVFGGATCADFIWQEIHIKVLAAHAWTESMTERHWLQKPTDSWTAWVANRVSIMKHKFKPFKPILEALSRVF